MSRALLAAGLPQTSLRDFLAAFLGGQGKTLASLPGVTPDILSVAEATAKETYLDAFKPVWYAAVGIGATALIAAIFTEDVGALERGSGDNDANVSRCRISSRMKSHRRSRPERRHMI